MRSDVRAEQVVEELSWPVSAEHGAVEPGQVAVIEVVVGERHHALEVAN